MPRAWARQIHRHQPSGRWWLRAEAHRGIVFVTEVTGERRAALISGPQVWTVAEAWLQHEPEHRTARDLADTLGLSMKSVETALAYWADNRQEIDGLITRHHLAQDEAVAAWELIAKPSVTREHHLPAR